MSHIRRARDEEHGFTLIELMVVVLIIAILIAIALPTYLGARRRAADRAIQANMRTSLAAALSYYAETADWTNFDATQANLEESRIDWVDWDTLGVAAPPAKGQVKIQVHLSQDLLLVGLSNSGTFFCLEQISTNPATITGSGAAFTDVDTIPECIGGW